MVQLGFRPAPLNRKFSRTCWPCDRVLYFRVPLHAVEMLLFVRESCHRCACSCSQDFEALRSFVNRVSVAHPGVLGVRNAGKDGTGFADSGGLGGAVLAQTGLRDFAAERVGHGLEAVANAEDRHAGLEKVRADPRGTLGINAGRSAGEDDRCRVLGQKLLGGERVRNNFRVHIRFTDAAGNQLRVLGTVVNNQHRLLGSLSFRTEGCGGSSHRNSLLCRDAPVHLEAGREAGKPARR